MYALRTGEHLGHELPGLVGGEAEDGRDEAEQSFANAPERGLRGLALAGRAREGVEAILENVKVLGAEIDCEKFVEALVDAMEEHLVIPGADFGGKIGGAQKHVLVERFELLECNQVVRGREAVQVSEDVAEGVANLAIVFRDALS